MNPEEIIVFFRLGMAWIISYIMFYTVISYAIRAASEREIRVYDDRICWPALFLAICLAFFSYERMAETLNHFSLYIVWSFLAGFVAIIIYQGVRNR